MKARFSVPSAAIGHNGAMRLKWLPASACCTLISSALLAGAPVRAGTPTVVTFEQVRPGAMPPRFRTLTSAEAEPGRWQVERVDGTPALSQVLAGREGYRLAALESPKLQNLRAGIRLRMGHAGDRAAGLAWRVRDARNYYAARLDLKEREFVLYKFVRGNRIRLSRTSDLRLQEAAWHELSIEHVGDRLKVWLNGIPVATKRDAALSGAGMVSLWLPGDSIAHFARLTFEPLRGE